MHRITCQGLAEAFEDLIVSILHAQGPPAHEAGVQFPVDAEVLDRTLLVGNLNPVVTLDQVRPMQHYFIVKFSTLEVSLRCFASSMLGMT